MDIKQQLCNQINQMTILSSDVALLYHYTTIKALFDGIIVKRPLLNKEICLWATNCRYMNDPTEIDVGADFNQELFTYDTEDIEDIKENSFIISLSQNVDYLPMWSMYGMNGSGIMIGFDRLMLEQAENTLLSRIIYLTKERKELLRKFKDDLYSLKKENKDDRVVFLLERLLYLSIFVDTKEASYEYEQEARIRINNKSKTNIKYRLKGNLIVPYVEQYYPKSALKEIWIGPTNDMNRATYSLRKYLDHMGFNEVEIKQSKVPYRD